MCFEKIQRFLIGCEDAELFHRLVNKLKPETSSLNDPLESEEYTWRYWYANENNPKARDFLKKKLRELQKIKQDALMTVLFAKEEQFRHWLHSLFIRRMGIANVNSDNLLCPHLGNFYKKYCEEQHNAEEQKKLQNFLLRLSSEQRTIFQRIFSANKSKHIFTIFDIILDEIEKLPYLKITHIILNSRVAGFDQASISSNAREKIHFALIHLKKCENAEFIRLDKSFSRFLSSKEINQLFAQLADNKKLRVLKIKNLSALSDQNLIYLANLIAQGKFPSLTTLEITKSKKISTLGFSALCSVVHSSTNLSKIVISKETWYGSAQFDFSPLAQKDLQESLLPLSEKKAPIIGFAQIRTNLTYLAQKYKTDTQKKWGIFNWFYRFFHGGNISQDKADALEELGKTKSEEIILAGLQAYIKNAPKTSGMRDKNSLATLLVDHLLQPTDSFPSSFSESKDSLITGELTNEASSGEQSERELEGNKPVFLSLSSEKAISAKSSLLLWNTHRTKTRAKLEEVSQQLFSLPRT